MIKSNGIISITIAALAILLVSFAAPALAAEKEAKVVGEGNIVKVHYKLTVDGEVRDSSDGKDPLEFTVGGKGVIPGFEKNIVGMKQGDKKSFTLSPEDGYGPHNAEAVREVPKNQMPQDVELKPGMVLYAQGQGGQPIPVVISDIKGDTVVLDFNHPMAGKTLNFDIEVVDIQ